MITERELLLAADGHIARTPTTVADIRALLANEGIDPDDLQALVASLRDLRGLSDEDKPGWGAGVIDGFLLGVRATREEVDDGT